VRTFLLPTKPVHSIVAGSPDLCQAQTGSQYYVGTVQTKYDKALLKMGLEFGRACQEWQAKFKAQHSRSGISFEHLLEHLEIPKTTAYRWMQRYEAKIGFLASSNEVEHAQDS
jgi:hypothetical protein